jgi:prepilin-type N-terminal cleavage/methylation domain-containing protein
MKTLSIKAKISGLTLIELIMVMFVLAILAAMLLPALGRPRISNGPNCMMNQQRIALGLIMFKDDNGGKFPWHLSVTNGGTMEYNFDGHPSSQFRSILQCASGLSMNSSFYICPSDSGRHAATNIAIFTDQNTSYFVNVDAAVATNHASAILTGDRHLAANGQPVKPGLFYLKNTSDMGWTRELHANSKYTPCGSLGFADGHAEIVTGKNLNAVFQRQGSVTNRLAVP